MASHLSDIGFDASCEQDVSRLAVHAVERGERIRAPRVRYIRWSVGGGAELWVRLGSRGTIVGMNPHFAGGAHMRVVLTSRIVRAGDTGADDRRAGTADRARTLARSSDGAFHAWANPSDEGERDSGDYPFVFDVPDFAACDNVSLPRTTEVQLAAFAHELTAFESEDDFYAWQEESANDDDGRTICFAAESFIPTGLFGGEDDDAGSPPAHATFHGVVLQAAPRQNEATGRTFCWAHVRTLGGEVDVVADPAIVRGTLVVGGVVGGTFWLSGRIPDCVPLLEPSFWRRLIGA